MENHWNFFIKVNFFIISSFSIRRIPCFVVWISHFSMMQEMLSLRVFFREKIEDHLSFFDRRIISYLQEKNIIFTKHTENIIFQYIFWERSSFIFRLKNRMVFSKKRNTIFPDNTKVQCNFFEKTIFLEHLGNGDMVFLCSVCCPKGTKLLYEKCITVFRFNTTGPAAQKMNIFAPLTTSRGIRQFWEIWF